MLSRLILVLAVVAGLAYAVPWTGSATDVSAATGGCAAEADAAGEETPADVLHPDIHDKVGDGSNANPNGQSPTGGAEIHGIGNVPGQGGNGPAGAGGFADDLTDVHGGIDACNPRA